jgi:ferredoxin-type protein NapH
MKKSKLRTYVALAICLIVAVGYVINTGLGTISAFGWSDISLLCPLGSLTALLAQKTLLPRVLIALVIAVVGMVLLGRFFCGWICPIPLIQKIPNLFRPKSKQKNDLVQKECAAGKEKTACDNAKKAADKPFDSRHVVLLGALLSATIFGFPVFCLICPIGLTFATIFLIISLFAQGDITWSLIVVPLVLITEVLIFKKWCHVFCPLSALMSLLSRKNKRILQPEVNTEKCIEANGGTCSLCAKACPEEIDPHNLAQGRHISECTKCHACVDTCPSKALSIKLFTQKDKE